MAKRYSPLYLQLKNSFDSHLQTYISQKEELILASPFSCDFLTKPFSPYKIRRFKSGKVRILYVIYKESPGFWQDLNMQAQCDNEILFLFVGLRNSKTYELAYKLLKREFGFFD